MKYIVWGQRSGKRPPMVDPKSGEMVDDGTNCQISLCTTTHKDLATYFYKSLRAQYSGHIWKLWLEEVK